MWAMSQSEVEPAPRSGHLEPTITAAEHGRPSDAFLCRVYVGSKAQEIHKIKCHTPHALMGSCSRGRAVRGGSRGMGTGVGVV